MTQPDEAAEMKENVTIIVGEAFINGATAGEVVDKVMALYLAAQARSKQATIEQIRSGMPSRPSNELIQQALQNGKPQQAASYNGAAATIDTLNRLLTDIEKGE